MIYHIIYKFLVCFGLTYGLQPESEARCSNSLNKMEKHVNDPIKDAQFQQNQF